MQVQSDRKYKRFRAVQDSDRMFKTDEKKIPEQTRKFQNRRENPRTDEKISVVGWDPDQADPPFPISENGSFLHLSRIETRKILLGPRFFLKKCLHISEAKNSVVLRILDPHPS